MTRKKPVFCINCQHYRTGFSDHTYEYCIIEQKKPIRYVATYYRHNQPVDPLSPREKNAKNNCPDYEAVER